MTPLKQPLIDINWPEATWDVSGCFVYDRELVAFSDFCERVLHLPRPLSWVHGAPPCCWNSGRLPNKNHGTRSYQCALDDYISRGIGILLTASNHLLRPEDLNDPIANNVCELLNQYDGRHGIILSSDVLHEYVKTHYPKIKRVSSILKITAERGRGQLELYRRYLDEFDYVMLHPDDVFDLSLIEQLPEPERCIALVNEYCIRHCRIRHLHYQSLSEGALHYLGYDDAPFNKAKSSNGCNNIYQLLTHPTSGTLALHHDEIDALYERGVRHFKVQGRGMGSAAPLLHDLMRLMWKDDAPEGNRHHALEQYFWESLNPPSLMER